MINLYLLCGPAGAGKSTWAKDFLNNNIDAVWISRDKIRFAILKDNDNYFAKENKVFNTFISVIKNAMTKYTDIIIDATHLNEKSRNKVLDRLPINEKVNIHIINFLTSEDKCLFYNSKRTGRKKVPDNVIKDMVKKFVPGTNLEKYYYFEIQNIIS